jgi:hypothetical protein
MLLRAWEVVHAKSMDKYNRTALILYFVHEVQLGHTVHSEQNNRAILYKIIK